MLLALDIGNTSITIGIFNGDDLIDVKRIPSGIHIDSQKYSELLGDAVNNINIDGCIIASVVNGLDKILYDVVQSLFCVEAIILTPSLNLGITLRLKDNNEIGADRIANGIAAKQLYSVPAIVVDFGTANTFDIVDKDGNFIGGVIAPGINTQFTSLSKCTSKLPKLDASVSETAIGDNTYDAIMSGVIRGTACMVEGLVKQCEFELGQKATIIATGGNSRLVSQYMTEQFDYIDPNLTLIGLKELYKLNLNSSHLLHCAL